MIIAEIITRTEARKRIKKSQSAFGLIDDWEGILYANLNDKKMCEAFMKRFPKKEPWLHFASSIENIKCCEEMDIKSGKYLICDTKLVQYKTTRALYKDFCKSEEELTEKLRLIEEKWDKMNNEEIDETNKEEK